MNAAHLHLLVNHVPLLCPAFAAALLARSLWRDDPAVGRVGAALGLVGALGAGLAWASGDPASETVEALPGVNEAIVEVHEERGEAAAAMVMVAGAVGLGSVLVGARHRRALSGAACLAAGAAFGMAAWAAEAGGRVRHAEEIGARAGAGTEGEGAEEAEEEGEDGER